MGKESEIVNPDSPPLMTNETPEKISQTEVLEEHTTVFDIESIAETCVLEELEDTLTMSDSVALLEHDASPTKYKVPNLKLTFEEEFKLYELDAMKETVQMGVAEIIWKSFPKLEECISSVAACLYLGLEDQILPGPMLERQMRFRNYINIDLASKGPIWNLLECFYMFKDIPDDLKREIFKFSLPVVELCYRAFFKANSDKHFLIDQKKAAGFRFRKFSKIAEKTIPNPRESLKSIDDFALSIFKSPWARKKSDEEFFNETLISLGNLVKDDVKLGTLYSTLVMITPEEDDVNNPVLAAVQNEVKLLLFRYLKHKYRDPQQASLTHSHFLELIKKLRICRNITIHGRKPLHEEFVFDQLTEQINL